MKHHHESPFSAIESAIRATGARVTYSRIRVLGLLQSAHAPLSHSEIEGQLNKQTSPEIDRVTLYRVLDWLVDVGLAHKAANVRGVFCFTLAQPSIKHKQHAHFRCNDCGKVICLDMAPPPEPKLPNGFRLTSMELDISGECPDCVESHSPHSDQRSKTMSALK